MQSTLQPNPSAVTLTELDIHAIAETLVANRSLQTLGHTQAQGRQVEACVAKVFGVRHEALRAATRGPAQVALARQAAMYLCHTTLGFSLTCVGELFERDRTTVSHACRLVEDRRDDEGFDMLISCLERSVAGIVLLCGGV
ncbi:MAG: helix-turn-helix domain-containing protein [Cohaesibacteraceae bacterium]|mgnify:CR=1 FL=1